MKNSQNLVSSYRHTQYRVAGDNPFILHIDERSKQIGELMASAGVDCAAFITASNPFSQLYLSEANRVANDSLLNYLREACSRIVDGAGEDRTGIWPSETSYLALGLSLENARNLALIFGQNAIVWVEADATPQLLLFGSLAN